jgi:hypothetical protein
MAVKTPDFMLMLFHVSSFVLIDAYKKELKGPSVVAHNF